MDTFISISFYGVKNSKQIAAEIEDIYYIYNDIADNYCSGSQTSIFDLNKNREAQISDELKELLSFALEMQQQTNGYFNPFIGKLSTKWKDCLLEKKLLTDDIILEELNSMNNTTLEINDNIAKINGNANIDLGGVAKGFATQKVKEYLDSIDCHNYLLNAGSSNIVLGSKNGQNFNVGLSNATIPGYFQILSCKDISISTSSIKEQHSLIDGIYYSHLINPKTGYPAIYYDSLSILGSDSGVLDAYTTACFSMELEQLKTFLNSKNLDYIISKNNELLYDSTGDKYEKK